MPRREPLYSRRVGFVPLGNHTPAPSASVTANIGYQARPIAAFLRLLPIQRLSLGLVFMVATLPTGRCGDVLMIGVEPILSVLLSLR